MSCWVLGLSTINDHDSRGACYPRSGRGSHVIPQPDHKVYRIFIVIRPNRMMLPSNGNPCNGGIKLVHSTLQCTRDDLLGRTAKFMIMMSEES